MIFRLYAPTIGNGSLAIVARAFATRLDALGLLAGVYPLDSADPNTLYDGADAPIAIVFGFVGELARVAHVGMHKLVFLQYAANSRPFPLGAAKSIRLLADGVITPSKWSRDAILTASEELQRTVDVVPHGVHPEFSTIVRTPPDDRFMVLHHAGSAIERKGTVELIQAMAGMKDVGLTISCDVPTEHELCVIWRRMAPSLPVFFPDRLSGHAWPRSAIEQMRRCHVVCQPSRSEGFGLVPLEARACGVPLAITVETGHREHSWKSMAGIYPIEVGREAPMASELGSMAPTVSPDEIRWALGKVIESYDRLSQGAMDIAEITRQKWTWSSQIDPWIKRVAQEVS
jgi:glycosyltransferase involved in cell wall biosynthesis